MILDTAKEKCIIQVLKILERKKTKYSALFKETKVSHITLQNALKEMVRASFFKKEDDEGYNITEKGRKLLRKLDELEEILKSHNRVLHEPC